MYKKVILALTVCAGMAMADDIQLPEPQKTGGKPLLEVLSARKSIREYSDKEITRETLSTLLWAANGVSRADGRRTAPTAKNAQEIDLYVVVKEGAYLYDAKKNALVEISKDDLREYVGMQDFAKTAPLTIVLTGDSDKLKYPPDDDRFISMANADAGFVSQNIYLFCASENLGTVVRGSVDGKTLAEKLNLPANKKVLLAQSIGYPKAAD